MGVEISVIVPIYNIENYIEKCINSILTQTFENFELLLINDGSQDKSVEICRKYLTDPRVRIISQRNKGLSAARNTGIRRAKGNYLFFVDGDDYVSSDLLEVLYNEMVLENADIVQCGFVWVMQNQEMKEENYVGLKTRKVLYRGEWFSYYERYSVLFTVAWNKLYRRELFHTLKYPEGKIFEDEYVNFPLYSRAEKVVIINKGMYYYVQRNEGICGSSGADKRIDAFLEYMMVRMKILWNYDKTKFYKYLYSYYKQLIYYDNMAREQGLEREYVSKMRKQAIRFMGCFLVHTKVSIAKKIEILKWNLGIPTK